MNEQKHTAGPWSKGPGIITAGHQAIASYTGCGVVRYADSEEEREANAKLIAAAPDLLSVLEELRVHCPDLLQKCGWARQTAHPLTGTGSGTMLDLVEAVIAKATA